jgi:hypothetical protein
MRAHVTTNRVRRHSSEIDDRPAVVPATTRIVGAPPVATTQPLPFGDLSAAPIDQLANLAAEQFGVERHGIRANRQGMTWLLERLSDYPGDTWQERWETAGLNEPPPPIGELAGEDTVRRRRINAAALQAYSIRLIRPSFAAFRATTGANGYPERFRRIAKDPLLEEFCLKLSERSVAAERSGKAIMDICVMMTVYGIEFCDLTAEAAVFYSDQAPGRTATAVLWPVLHEMGRFPSWVPRTLQDARIRGQRSIEELVGRHQLRNTEVRELLIDYLQRRAVEIDYSTLDNLVRNLIEYFWKVIEDINPDQADLRLDEHTVGEWKRRVSVRKDGKPRLHLDSTFLTVRAFYLDLQTWSAAEPERWARWVAPVPIRDADLRWFTIRRRRLNERMANRTRDRQALLPILSEYVASEWNRYRTLLEAARQVGLGERFVVDGVSWQRTTTDYDLDQQSRPGESIRVISRDTGELVMGDRRNVAPGWPAARRTRRTDAPERAAVSAAQRGGRRAAGHQPVEE